MWAKYSECEHSYDHESGHRTANVGINTNTNAGIHMTTNVGNNMTLNVGINTTTNVGINMTMNVGPMTPRRNSTPEY